MAKIVTYRTTVNSQASLEIGLRALADYLYKEGAIKVETKWDPKLNTNRTCYKIDAMVETEE